VCVVLHEFPDNEAIAGFVTNDEFGCF